MGTAGIRRNGPPDRSLQRIASDILTLPLDGPQSRMLQPTTFATCLQDNLDPHEPPDTATQLERHGLADFTDRATALLKLLRKIAAGKSSFSRTDMETLKDSLNVVHGELKIRKAYYLEELEECRQPDMEFHHLLGKIDEEKIRALAAGGYYTNKHIAENMEQKIIPLFSELAAKLHITLSTPEIAP
jgi:hypothetical protein